MAVKKGPGVGKTQGGQGMKLMVAADNQAIPLGGYLCLVSPAEVTLVDIGLTGGKGVDRAFVTDKADDSQS